MFFLPVTTILTSISDSENPKSVTELLEQMTICIMCLSASSQVLIINLKRKSISKVLQMTNEKSLAILMVRNGREKYRNRRNRIQLFSILLLILSILLSVVVLVSISLQYFLNNQTFFVIFYASNELLSHFQFAFHLMIFLWGSMHFPNVYIMMIELILRISLNYEILADNLRSITDWSTRHKTNENYQCFNRAMKEFHDLQIMMNELNKVICVYVSPLIAISINTTGFFVAVLVNASSLADVLTSCTIPLWLFSYLASFCIMGEVLKESVSVEIRINIGLGIYCLLMFPDVKGPNGCIFLRMVFSPNSISETPLDVAHSMRTGDFD